MVIDLSSREQDLPAWSLRADRRASIAFQSELPERIDREWAWGGSRGEGVRVCLLDSGVEELHPDVAPVSEAYVVTTDGVQRDAEGDPSGHGTGCASIVRRIAPEAELTSVRVLGGGARGAGADLIAGLGWAVERGFDVINLSLSTTRRRFAGPLHDLADRCYFAGSMLVACAHNMPVESYPWRFGALISVGSHDGDDPLDFLYNPVPPVEFFAPGIEVEIAWSGGQRIKASGNSFATPHLSGVIALIRAKHPGLTPFELKTVLRQTASNAGGR